MSRFRVLPAVLVSLVFMVSCIVAGVAAVKYYKSTQYYEAEAELPVPAEKVFQTAVSITEEKPDLQTLEKDESKGFLKVTDGRQKSSLKVKAVDDGRSEIVIRADLPKEEKELEKELALRIIEQICTRLAVKCTVEEK
jgi:hypothetical protein